MRFFIFATFLLLQTCCLIDGKPVKDTIIDPVIDSLHKVKDGEYQKTPSEPSNGVYENEDRGASPLPWHVGIYIQPEGEPENGTPVLACTGAIVTKNAVLSSAHCFYANSKGDLVSPSRVRVAAGKTNNAWNHDVHQERVQEVQVKSIHKKEKSADQSRRYWSDIVVLILQNPLTFNEYVNQAHLPLTPGDVVEMSNGLRGLAAGWNFEDESRNPKGVLRTIEMPVVDKEECKTRAGPYGDFIVSDDRFCAGYTNGTVLCGVDSGSGLAFKDSQNGQWFVEGIASVGVPNEDRTDCRNDVYTIFNRVAVHSDWIRNTIQEHS